MTTQITPEALAEARELAKKHCNTTRSEQYEWTALFDDDGIAALINEVREAATAAERERCLACVPGGSWVDPQQVADEIRRGK